MEKTAKAGRPGQPRKIVLASASPRRDRILRKAGLTFIVDAANGEEDHLPGLGPVALARALSQQKARTVAVRHRNAIIIAADTLLSLKGKVLGKPHSEEHSRQMLRLLSGKEHRVITAFTILDTANNKELTRHVSTKVFFGRISEREIDAYIATGEPMDKAGSYGIQGRGALLVKKIEGDYFNVVGLPLQALSQGLKKFGIALM